MQRLAVASGFPLTAMAEMPVLKNGMRLIGTGRKNALAVERPPTLKSLKGYNCDEGAADDVSG